MKTFTAYEVHDLRFPTSQHLDGSDAMNPDPDYSAAYIILHTDEGQTGHGFVFTIGRGNDVVCKAIDLVAARLVNRALDETLADLGGVWKELVGDSQLRWLGPEKGVMHMAIGAVINALWDLRAKRENKPLWLLLAELSPQEIVDLVDFRYLTDALTKEEALEILERAEPTRQARINQLRTKGYGAYTTTPGWLGYSDEKLARLCREAIEEGFPQIKLKVGDSIEDDVRRLGIARETCGEGYPIAIDANQRWDVSDAVGWVKELEKFDLAWVEEPTSPDDVLAHAAIADAIAPVPVATGEHCQSRVLAKQFFQAKGLSIYQMDACRVAGVNENIAILLMAAKFGIRVCPHAGGVGLCELVQHMSMFDFISVSTELDHRMIEYVDHLHEHFITPVDVHDGRYWPPEAPGTGAEIKTSTISEFSYPTGPVWAQ